MADRNIKRVDRRTLAGCFRRFVILCAILALIPAGLVIWGFNNEYRRCVELPNGLYLGYSAVFDLTNRPFLLPNPSGTIKYGDGTPLVDHRLWEIFVSDSSAYGYTFSPRKDFSFTWRADTGLVLREDDPETYDAIVREAGETNYGIGPGSFDPAVLMRHLAGLPGFEEKWCTTRLFRWRVD